MQLKTKISETLRRLMFEKNIKAVELARLTQLPQPTVQRMVSGTCANPHLSTLIPIAKFFGITVEQLKGQEPIGAFEATQNMTQELLPIPMLTWQEAAQWSELKKNFSTQNGSKTLYVENKISRDSFAVTMDDSSMYPLFPLGTAIIIDPQKPIKDRSYVVIRLHNQSRAIFRQLLLDADKRYLKSLSPDLEQFPMTLMAENDQICGTLVQARRDFEE